MFIYVFEWRKSLEQFPSFERIVCGFFLVSMNCNCCQHQWLVRATIHNNLTLLCRSECNLPQPRAQVRNTIWLWGALRCTATLELEGIALDYTTACGCFPLLRAGASHGVYHEGYRVVCTQTVPREVCPVCFWDNRISKRPHWPELGEHYIDCCIAKGSRCFSAAASILRFHHAAAPCAPISCT